VVEAQQVAGDKGQLDLLFFIGGEVKDPSPLGVGSVGMEFFDPDQGVSLNTQKGREGQVFSSMFS